MYYYRRDSAELLHFISDVSDKRTRVDVVFDHYLQNFIKAKEERKHKPKGDLSRGIRRIVESRWEQRIGD